MGVHVEPPSVLVAPVQTLAWPFPPQIWPPGQSGVVEPLALQLMTVSQLTASPQLYPSCAHVCGAHAGPASPLGTPPSAVPAPPQTFAWLAPHVCPAGQPPTPGPEPVQSRMLPQLTAWPQS